MVKLPINKVLKFLFHHLRFILVMISILFVFSFLILIINRKDAGALFAEAMEAVGTNRHAEAIELLRTIERQYPRWHRRTELDYQLGNLLYFHQHDIPGAMEAWARVLQSNRAKEFDYAIHARLASIYQNEVADMNRAREHWRYLIEHYAGKPGTDEFRLHLVDSFIRMDQFESALIEIKNQLPEIQDDHVRQQCLIKMGTIYNIQKNYTRSRQVLEGIAANPHCIHCKNQCLMVLADTLEVQEDYEKAIDILGRIPDNVLSKEEKMSRISNIRKKTVTAPAGHQR